MTGCRKSPEDHRGHCKNYPTAGYGSCSPVCSRLWRSYRSSCARPRGRPRRRSRRSTANSSIAAQPDAGTHARSARLEMFDDGLVDRLLGSVAGRGALFFGFPDASPRESREAKLADMPTGSGISEGKFGSTRFGKEIVENTTAFLHQWKSQSLFAYAGFVHLSPCSKLFRSPGGMR